MARAYKKRAAPNVTASDRRTEAEATTRAGVKQISSKLYERKWAQFCCFCKYEKIQEGNGVIDPNGRNQPCERIVGKITEYFHYKVVELGCDYGEVVNIRSSLASIYKRTFGRTGIWKVNSDGSTQGSPTNSIHVNESVSYYKREKKKICFKRALPFRYRYLLQLWNHANTRGRESIFYSYLMGATSVCFTLWFLIDELVKLTWSDVRMNELNENGVPYHMVQLKDRKYMRTGEGQCYALYRQEIDECACSFVHLDWWIKKYRTLLGRDFLPTDALFPDADEGLNTLFFGESVVQGTFMKTINDVTRKIGTIPKNSAGEDMGKSTLHCFRRGGSHHRFVTGKFRWPLDVVKWWGVWGIGDDVNTIIRYLLEETSKYESNYTHYLYTMGSDSRLFNTIVSTLDDVSREIQSVQTCVVSRMDQMEQSTAAYKLFFSQQLERLNETIVKRFNALKMSLGKEKRSNCEEEDSNEDAPLLSSTNPTNFSHIPSVKNWKEVIQHWTEGCSEKNLTIALKDWPTGTRTKSLKYKYHDRKLIACEYLSLDHEEFIAKYTPDSITLKDLKKRFGRRIR